MPITHDPAVDMPTAFRLGDWWVEPMLNRISRGGDVVRLRPRAMDVLVCLAESTGEVATRQYLIDTVWRTEFVSDNALTHVITELRTELGDDARNPSYIESIPRRGYRLIAKVEFSERDEAGVAEVVRLPVTETDPGIDETSEPYPGLAAFGVEDAEFFFGREAEVARMWRAVTSRRLLALIGPSGVGKSSFLRAGVMSAAPEGWGVAICQPGESPFAGLAQGLVAELADDPDELVRLVNLGDPDDAVEVVRRWRQRHDEALLIVDQFEELFTQNSTEQQARFAKLLGRLAREADVHVLLSMRDDFVYECTSYEALRPIFDEMTPLEQPGDDALRRALVAPAARLGYTFEDDALVDEMVAEVAEERAALPLLAFAAQRLWDERDRARRLLTREASQRIGGVAGALVRSSEATLEALGEERLPIVRELFRNLVTAKGTRAARTADELLSVFETDKRQEAAEVVDRLVEARLLTSFQDDSAAGTDGRRLEIVHESLLGQWPRLVRWQTQDADGALLRDQLRQSARLWQERGRADDLLWTGSTFHELQLWRERYPGGLTEQEEAFANATTSLATRQRRRRRIAAAAGVVILLVVLGVLSVLWRRSALEARRAEAQRLLALGQIELEENPTAALAWARASLEVADTREGRLFALRALSHGPIYRALDPHWESEGVAHGVVFSPDGEWAAVEAYGHLKVYHRSGGAPVFTDEFPVNASEHVRPGFDASGRWLGAVKRTSEQTLETRVYEVPGFAEVARFEERIGEGRRFSFVTRTGFLGISKVGERLEISLRPFGAPPRSLGSVATCDALHLDSRGRWFGCARGGNALVYSLEEAGFGPLRTVHAGGEIVGIRLHPDLEWLVADNQETAEFEVWPLDEGIEGPSRSFDSENLWLAAVDPQGFRIVAKGSIDGTRVVSVWDLRSPDRAKPLIFRTSFATHQNRVAFDPSGRWLVTAHASMAAFWPLPPETPVTLPGGNIDAVAFSADGESLITAGGGGVRLLPLAAGTSERLLLDQRVRLSRIAIDPPGRFAVVTDMWSPGPVIVPLDGSDPKWLDGFDPAAVVVPVAYDPDRELVAAAPRGGPRDQQVIRVWRLRDGSVRVLGPADDAGEGGEGGFEGVEFLPDGGLLSCGSGGLRRWDLEDQSSELVVAESCGWLDVTADGRTAAAVRVSGNFQGTGLVLVDLSTGVVRRPAEHQGNLGIWEFGPAGDVFACSEMDDDGTIKVGHLSGGEPHLLFGHDTKVSGLAFSPDGRRLASLDDSGRIRVWTLPDLSKPPLHDLPYGELMAKLDAITNVRMVADDDSSNGYRLENGPFPGWAEAPQW